MPQKITELQNQLEKIIKGKKDITDKILMAVLAKGHVLLEDVPGVGKTTTALALSRLMGMEFNRIQFTPDVVPSDVTGFTMYDKQNGQFSYHEGAVMCNLLLADEINRTSSKTQSALLEVMEEGKVTVDGETHCVPSPFVVIATENPVGSSGTQLLPESQLDRFMISVSMGYPDHQSLVELLRDRQKENPLENAKTVVTRDEVLKLQKEVQEIYVAGARLCGRPCGSYKETCADHAGIKPAWNPGTGKDGKSSCLHERKGLCHSKGCAGGIQGRCGTQDDPGFQGKVSGKNCP